MIENLDHIVYAVPDLKSGIDYISTLLGTEITIGGNHEHYGTHNALIRIGATSYLEIIAVDPLNTKIPSPRWMGVDLLKSHGQITRWAVKAKVNPENLSLLGNYKYNLGKAVAGTRLKPDGTLLTWKLSLPASLPLVESCPFIIEWPENLHPATSLPFECQIKELIVKSVDSEKVEKITSILEPNTIIEQAPKEKIIAVINCPNGEVKLM